MWRVNLDFNDYSFFQSHMYFVLTYSCLSLWLFSRSFYCPLSHPLLKIMICISLIAGKSSALFLFFLLHFTHYSVLLHCPCSVISSKLFIHIVSCLLLTPSHNEVVAFSGSRSSAIIWKMLDSNLTVTNLGVSWDDFRRTLEL